MYTYVLGKTKSVKNLDLNRKDFTLCVELPIKATRNGMKIGSINSFERARIAGKKGKCFERWISNTFLFDKNFFKKN